MIELTDQQIEALKSAELIPPRVVNPKTSETFVLIEIDEYDRLQQEPYDDSPWTREELSAAAWEAGRELGWEDMDEYDDAPEQP
jgi:hypothetical protein